MEEHICRICGKKFKTKYKQAEYCSDECRKEAARRRDAARVRIGRWRKRKVDNLTLEDLIKQATAADMSYGNFVSMRSIGKI